MIYNEALKEMLDGKLPADAEEQRILVLHAMAQEFRMAKLEEKARWASAYVFIAFITGFFVGAAAI